MISLLPQLLHRIKLYKDTILLLLYLNQSLWILINVVKQWDHYPNLLHYQNRKLTCKNRNIQDQLDLCTIKHKFQPSISYYLFTCFIQMHMQHMHMPAPFTSLFLSVSTLTLTIYGTILYIIISYHIVHHHFKNYYEKEKITLCL